MRNDEFFDSFGCAIASTFSNASSDRFSEVIEGQPFSTDWRNAAHCNFMSLEFCPSDFRTKSRNSVSHRRWRAV